LKLVSGRQTQSRKKAAAKDFRRIYEHYISLSVLCGSILQLADIGLYLCSPGGDLPEHFSQRGISTSFAKYSVGREVHGLPIGFYIHAGRNQFAHWGDEEELDPDRRWPAGFHPFVQTVFDHLLEVHYGHPFADLVYNLGNDSYGGAPVRATNIVREVLGWDNYVAYAADMASMIGNGGRNAQAHQ
jgi:hypothetical protein